MIEAVNSVISNAQLARVSTDQVATSNSFAADATAVESVARAPVAPYISPYISVDTRFDTAVLQIRDSDTGDVLTQFPSESRLRAAAQSEAAQTLAETQTSTPAPQPAAEAPSPSETTFQATSIAQASVQPASSSAGAAQAAIAALSAGAQSGLATSTVSVTA